MTTSLSGVLVALATPFTADDDLDEPRLRELVDRTIDGGVHGVVACGSTGEFSALTLDERRRVVEVVVDQTAHRVPVVAQTGSTSTAEAVRLAAQLLTEPAEHRRRWEQLVDQVAQPR